MWIIHRFFKFDILTPSLPWIVNVKTSFLRSTWSCGKQKLKFSNPFAKVETSILFLVKLIGDPVQLPELQFWSFDWTFIQNDGSKISYRQSFRFGQVWNKQMNISERIRQTLAFGGHDSSILNCDWGWRHSIIKAI